MAAQDTVSSVYRVTEIIGTSPNSWEDAARNAFETAAKSLRDLRIAEVCKLDMRLDGDRWLNTVPVWHCHSGTNPDDGTSVPHKASQ